MSDIFAQENALEKRAELDAFIDSQTSKEDAIISVLHKAQSLFGYLPSDLQLYVARKLGVPAARVYGVVSFYSYFSQKKRGDFTINICMGTACFVKGVDKVMDEFSNQLGVKNGETTEDGLFTLKDVRCIGACGLAPVVMVNEKVYGHVKPEDVSKIITACKVQKGV
ncbi:NADH-quinone oxidoreductase subunit NuoE family protein [Fusibacter tunisiensis]|uniref:NADH-quinone oxidoreductase subunit E/NADP-reducing hydrogenase subunit HndA n=1 Tax=Fusibacter tunisiensis TaxID=1008308 RepID=A0ABS2MRM0_9FIRM|nr:NAD(P)H-dependent oxidoreductase subunit E [Fusibacter tunisiensis]MBM7562039.1 NADH-quinone oxidoreductase subunit E/NADP-reducing hydrogenase subunit HndA [Fusibacter tunisiensis]